MFIDDLLSFKPKVSFGSLIVYLSHKVLYCRQLCEAYELAGPEYFFARLEQRLPNLPELAATSDATGKDFTNRFLKGTGVDTFYKKQGILARVPQLPK